MKIDYTGKTVIVTGARDGIGKSIAQKFIELNATVIITGRSTAPEWSDRYSNCTFYRLDFHDHEGVREFQNEISKYEKLDVLINNAGIQIKHEVDEIRDEDWNRVIDVNLTGPMKMMRMVVPKMKKQGSGHILNISSVAGLISKPRQSSYSASKSGLIGLTKSSALDLAKFNIKVNVLCPGTTYTPMVDKLLNETQQQQIKDKVPMGRFADVSEIANFTMMLCSDYNTFMTGESIILDGGFTAQ
jgi:3-oxoacyl-[acyl-carrier protein] reductase